jgi:hypothetical protein
MLVDKDRRHATLREWKFGMIWIMQKQLGDRASGRKLSGDRKRSSVGGLRFVPILYRRPGIGGLFGLLAYSEISNLRVMST